MRRRARNRALLYRTNLSKAQRFVSMGLRCLSTITLAVQQLPQTRHHVPCVVDTSLPSMPRLTARMTAATPPAIGVRDDPTGGHESQKTTSEDHRAAKAGTTPAGQEATKPRASDPQATSPEEEEENWIVGRMLDSFEERLVAKREAIREYGSAGMKLLFRARGI